MEDPWDMSQRNPRDDIIAAMHRIQEPDNYERRWHRVYIPIPHIKAIMFRMPDTQKEWDDFFTMCGTTQKEWLASATEEEVERIISCWCM